MTEKDTIMAAVPLRNRKVMLEANQSVKDIIRALTYYHKKYAKQYDQFARQFDVGDERAIAKALFRFCKKHIDYVIEDEEKQTVRSPARILSEEAGDCKHYASFIAGVLDSLKRCGLDLDWAYRFAKYKDPWTGKVNNHVFVVLWDQHDKEIWIDPVLNWFDYHLPYTSAVTKTVNTLPKEAVGCPGSACNCSRVGATGDQYMPVPAGYPTNLPRPVLTADHQLVLRDNYKVLSTQEIAWIQQALQPLIIQYASRPYNIYWSIRGWGSGAADIFTAGGNMLASLLNKPTHDFLQYPPQPSGLDNFLIGLNDVVPTLIGLGANAVLPGSGGVASSIVSSQTSPSGGNTAVDLSAAQLANNQQQTQTSILPTLSNGNLLPLLLIGVGLYFATKK